VVVGLGQEQTQALWVKRAETAEHTVLAVVEVGRQLMGLVGRVLVVMVLLAFVLWYHIFNYEIFFSRKK
jgi:cytochrome bd-type quinol oxidase subunit 2